MARIRGTGGADTLHGTSHGDTILGLGGDDFLYGDAGGDTLKGGGGDDHLYAGNGINQLDGGDGDDTFYIVDPDGSVAGGAGFDTLLNESTHGLDLSDMQISGVESFASLHRTDLTLTAAQLNGFGNVSARMIWLSTADDIDVSGGSVTGTIHLNSAGQVFTSIGPSQVQVLGGLGRNVLTISNGSAGGDAADDVLTVTGNAVTAAIGGGGGTDSFYVDVQGGSSVSIYDYKRAEHDTIRINAEGVDSFDDLHVNKGRDGADAIIKYNDVTLHLLGVRAKDISASDFSFGPPGQEREGAHPSVGAEQAFHHSQLGGIGPEHLALP